MRGYPVTRAVSPDGRWAYTLYDGGGRHPFVHALDTAAGTAACIDVEALAGRTDLMDVGLAVADGGAEVRIVAGGETVAVIDAKTLRLSEPSPARPPADPRAGTARLCSSAWERSCSPAWRAWRSCCGGEDAWSQRRIAGHGT